MILANTHSRIHTERRPQSIKKILNSTVKMIYIALIELFKHYVVIKQFPDVCSNDASGRDASARDPSSHDASVNLNLPNFFKFLNQSKERLKNIIFSTLLFQYQTFAFYLKKIQFFTW